MLQYNEQIIKRRQYKTIKLSFFSCRVFRLNEEIAKVCKIPVEKQVLLISGGEPLNREKLVCSYSAGSVSMTIFCFLHSLSV